jgi:ATP-dependent Clp protease ATP-binding subunit ClpC
MFSKLSLDDMKKIVDIQMEEVRQRLSENGIEFELDDDARQWLATIGYDQAFGARPLKRALQKYVESPISTKYLGGELKRGDKIQIKKKADAEELEFLKQI